MAVVTRVLSQDAAGQYFVLMGIILATYFLGGLGLPDGVVRFVPALMALRSTLEATGLLSIGLKYSLVTIPIGAAICVGAVQSYTNSWQIAAVAGAWWAAYAIIFVSAQAIVASGRGEIGTAVFYSAANIGQILITVPTIFVAGLSQLESVIAATAIGTTVTAIGSLIYAWLTCERGSRTPDVPLLDAWRQGAIIAAGRVVQACLLWSPVWVVSLTFGEADAALVGLACRLVSAVAAVLAAVRFSIRPSLARDAAQDNWRAIENHASHIALYATILAVTAVAVTALFGDSLIGLVFGDDYRGAGVITALMLIGTVGECVGGPVDEILRMSGNATDVILFQTIGLAIGIGSQLLVSRWGELNAVVATYGITFMALYFSYIARLHSIRGIFVLARFSRHASRAE